MNLVDGNIISDKECDLVLETLEERLHETLKKPPLDVNLVINACDKMVKNLDKLEAVQKLDDFGINPRLRKMYLLQLEKMFGADAIKERLRLELGEELLRGRRIDSLGSGVSFEQGLAPLGVLFHITAGNVDGLPFVSLLEGLLTGNINIVKLPKEEGGITVSLLKELFNIEPSLKEYVYVFDYSSKDLKAIARLCSLADAIVVWGGDSAVSAVRSLAHVNTKIIEWGHKISFAYMSGIMTNEQKLEKLAQNIVLTNQLFCSSCQGVFLDTESMDEVYEFCQKFLPILEKVARENPFCFGKTEQLFVDARVTLELYNRQLESLKTPDRIFKGEGCSVYAASDNNLEASIMYRNVWVKRLKREDIILLRKHKSHLLAAALICENEDYNTLSNALISAGVIKVSDGFEMSNYAIGEAHDGVFPLRQYIKIVQKQVPN